MSDTGLRWQLRQLPREIDPARDLWPGIAARLPAPRRRPRWLPLGLAMAASLLLAIGIGLRWLPPGQAAEPQQARMLAAETEAMVREFEAALIQLGPQPLPSELRADIETLDRSAEAIRHALRADPGSARLLDQLRRTYARRLALTQRAYTS